MNKSELIEAIAKHADISKAAAGRALDATVTSIRTSLKKGGMVTLVGFGTFHAAERKPRMGRDPRTSEVIEIPARIVPRFKPGRLLVEKLNETTKKKRA
ncbi:MAG: HU family DNA-binding protein [Burkholderiales bacterium]|nr:HU family DNA-binding protein [Burkholderiales bacterium]